jgi:hypothetical protein
MTLATVTAVVGVVAAVLQFADGRPVFGVIWSVLAVWWLVYAAFLSRRPNTDTR